MSPPRIAKPFRRRLPSVLIAADWRRIAWAPSYRGPRAADVLNAPAFEPPGPPPVSPEERGLLAAVLAAPDADEPRLRYADWYDRQGDPRGAFIREQIAWWRAARVSNPVPTGWGSSRPTHADPSPNPKEFAPWSAADFVYARGFVESLSLAGRSFISLGEPLFRMTPLREVRLVAVAWYLTELARTPHLAKLERLDLSGNKIGPAGVRELAGSPFLDRLTGLNLSGNALGRAGIQELLRSPWRAQLRSLAITDNALDTAGVEELASDSALHGLTELHLAKNSIGPLGLPLEQLRILNLRFCRIGPTGATRLSKQGLRHLEDLDLGFNDLGDTGAESLARAAKLGRLRRLGLRANRIGPIGAAALAASDKAAVVADLDLTSNHLGDTGAAALLAGNHFAALERLDLSNNGLTDAGVRRLVETGAFDKLTALSLAWNPFGDAVVQALTADSALSGLRVLDLTGTHFGVVGAKALLGSRHRCRLTLGENRRLPADLARMLMERFGTTT